MFLFWLVIFVFVFVYFRFDSYTHIPSTQRNIPFIILAVLFFKLMFDLKCPWPPKNFNNSHNSTIFTRLNTESIGNSRSKEHADALRDITNVNVTVEKTRNFICHFSNCRSLLTFSTLVRPLSSKQARTWVFACRIPIPKSSSRNFIPAMYHLPRKTEFKEDQDL